MKILETQDGDDDEILAIFHGILLKLNDVNQLKELTTQNYEDDSERSFSFFEGFCYRFCVTGSKLVNFLDNL
jgi:hypothetical protein